MSRMTANLARAYASLVTRHPRRKSRRHLPSVRSSSGLEYLSDGSDGHYLDVFWSVENMRPMPVIVFFNSGAFFHGNRSTSSELCQSLAQRGFAVINADFRNISDTVSVEDELKDVMAMFNWMNLNRAHYGLDLDRCYVMGSSYGALMAMWFSLLCNSRRINRAMGINGPWMKVRGIGLISGMTDVNRNMARMMIVRDSIDRIGKENRELAEALVLESNHELRYLPPVFQVTSDADSSKPDVRKLQKLLDDNKLDNTALVFEAKQSLTRGFVNREPYSPEGVRTVSAMLRFLGHRVNDAADDPEDFS